MTVDANYYFDLAYNPGDVLNAWRILSGEGTFSEAHAPEYAIVLGDITYNSNSGPGYMNIMTARHSIHHHTPQWFNGRPYQGLAWCNATDRKVAVFVALAMVFGGSVVPRDTDPDTYEEFEQLFYPQSQDDNDYHAKMTKRLLKLQEITPRQIRAAREAWGLPVHKR